MKSRYTGRKRRIDAGLALRLFGVDRNDPASSIIDLSTSSSESGSESEAEPSDDGLYPRTKFNAGNGPGSVSSSESDCSSDSNLATSNFTREGVPPFRGDVRSIDLSGVAAAGFCDEPSSFLFLVGVSGKGRVVRLLKVSRATWLDCGAGSDEVMRFFRGESLDGSSRSGRFNGDLRLGVDAAFVGVDVRVLVCSTISAFRALHLSSTARMDANVLCESLLSSENCCFDNLSR